jgi:hypothetical protein
METLARNNLILTMTYRFEVVGMKGSSVSAASKRFHEQLASLGCIACLKDGRYNPIVSIHHINGRTRPGAHMSVLPLCAGHHQEGTGAPGLIAVHPWKRRFEDTYGTQHQLLAECLELIGQPNRMAQA